MSKRRYRASKDVYNILNKMDKGDIPSYQIKELHERGYVQLKKPHRMLEWHLTDKGKKFYKK